MQEHVGVSPKVRLCRAQFCPMRMGQSWRVKVHLSASLCTLLVADLLHVFPRKRSAYTTTKHIQIHRKTRTTDIRRVWGKFQKSSKIPYGVKILVIQLKFSEIFEFSGIKIFRKLHNFPGPGSPFGVPPSPQGRPREWPCALLELS